MNIGRGIKSIILVAHFDLVVEETLDQAARTPKEVVVGAEGGACCEVVVFEVFLRGHA
jgi:hypothetical protein